MSGIAVSVRFPFGRYAATPWFRSRREEVGNVEWPPSPWRIARALIAAAHATGGDVRVEAAASLVRNLAATLPRYHLPRAAAIAYTQWMPQLAFDDSPAASQRGDNGHALLAVSPETSLVVTWPRLFLKDREQELLGELCEAIPYLGQSVSVCELRVLPGPPAGPGWARAAPVGADEPVLEVGFDQRVVRLLAPEPGISRSELELSTGRGDVRAMPAPPGTRWVDYRLLEPRPRPPALEPMVHGVVYRLVGDDRPGRATALALAARRPALSIGRLMSRALFKSVSDASISLVDDDDDGRAERLVLRVEPPTPSTQARTLLDPPKRLIGPGLDCALIVERVDWRPRPVDASSSDLTLIAFRLDSVRLPGFADALVVAETWRRRMLGVAGRLLGADRIPARLSGKRSDGTPLADQHRHLHILPTSADGSAVDRLLVWAPDGFAPHEAAVVRGTTLPMMAGATIRLSELLDPEPAASSASVWKSHTPFLPPRHQKRRGGTLIPTLNDQVKRELGLRGFPAPLSVERDEGEWSRFRILRREKAGSHAGLGAHGFRLVFAEPVKGPITLGRNSHFGMGLFMPVT